MSILDRAALEASPIADLHAIASELSIDGYRRLRKAELVDAILTRQDGGEASTPEAAAAPAERESEPAAEAEEAAEETAPSRRRGRRGGRGRGGASRAAQDEEAETAEEAEEESSAEEAPRAKKARSAREDRAEEPESEPERAEQEIVEGVVELLPGGSGFVRVQPPDPSDDDVYVSSAQVKRCELVTGDRVSGPRRAPRRSERFASLVRVDTVNGRPATELADSARFEDLPVAFPDRRLELPSGDSALEVIERAAPIGRGSRVSIVGPPAAGKSELLRRLATALSGVEDIQLWVVLVGVRPEELPDWERTGVTPAAALSFATSVDAQSQALEGAIEQVRRLVARGAHAVVLVDTLDGVLPLVARKALACARNVVDGGSLTVIATASGPLGGETSVIALARPSSEGRFPVVDRGATWMLHRERLD
jgi:transcription termination factor Rho